VPLLGNNPTYYPIYTNIKSAHTQRKLLSDTVASCSDTMLK